MREIQDNANRPELTKETVVENRVNSYDLLTSKDNSVSQLSAAERSKINSTLPSLEIESNTSELTKRQVPESQRASAETRLNAQQEAAAQRIEQAITSGNAAQLDRTMHEFSGHGADLTPIMHKVQQDLARQGVMIDYRHGPTGDGTHAMHDEGVLRIYKRGGGEMVYASTDHDDRSTATKIQWKNHNTDFETTNMSRGIDVKQALEKISH